MNEKREAGRRLAAILEERVRMMRFALFSGSAPFEEAFFGDDGETE